MKSRCALLLFLFVFAASWAASADEERERLRVERVKVEADFAAKERECQKRFVVTSCVDRARRERRQDMDSLRKQQEVLDEADRKQRAAERMEEIGRKESDQDSRERTVESAPLPREVQRLPRERAPRPAASQPASGHRFEDPHKAADEARSREEYERRQQEARAHRIEIERRNTARAASGKLPAKPLSVPDAASAASARR